MASFHMRLLPKHSPPFLSAHLPYNIHSTLSNLALCLPCCSSSSPPLQSEGDRLDQRNAGRHRWPRLGIGQTGGKTDCPTRLVMTISSVVASVGVYGTVCCLNVAAVWAGSSGTRGSSFLTPRSRVRGAYPSRGRLWGILRCCQRRSSWPGGCAESIERVPPYHPGLGTGGPVPLCV